ncbi:hypothetical protein ACSBR1_024374 [Camellia fascicularis]
MKYVNASYKIGLLHKLHECVYTPTVSCFNEKLEVSKKCSPVVIDDFMTDLHPKHWANAYFRGQRYDEMCSNAAESFNNWVSDARHLPITRLVDMINEFPCSHAVVAFRNSGQDIHESIDRVFHIETFKSLYSGTIYPIPTVDMPSATTTDYMITPPIVKRLLGRPKRKRIPSRGEEVQRIRCGRCGKLGNHNRKTYKELI